MYENYWLSGTVLDVVHTDVARLDESGLHGRSVPVTARLPLDLTGASTCAVNDVKRGG